MAVRELRFATSMLLIGAGLFAVLRGAAVIGYSWASLGAPTADALKAYAGAPGVGAAAREALVAAARTPAELREAAQQAVIARPMSGALWLALAQADLASGQPLEKALAAVAMSSVTAPNEGSVMAGRAVFLLPLWPSLPADMRRSALDDLSQAWNAIAPRERRAMATSVARFDEADRARLQAALLASGSGSAGVLRDLGLEVAPATGQGAD